MRTRFGNLGCDNDLGHEYDLSAAGIALIVFQDHKLANLRAGRHCEVETGKRDSFIELGSLG